MHAWMAAAPARPVGRAGAPEGGGPCVQRSGLAAAAHTLSGCDSARAQSCSAALPRLLGAPAAPACVHGERGGSGGRCRRRQRARPAPAGWPAASLAPSLPAGGPTHLGRSSGGSRRRELLAQLLQRRGPDWRAGRRPCSRSLGLGGHRLLVQLQWHGMRRSRAASNSGRTRRAARSGGRWASSGRPSVLLRAAACRNEKAGKCDPMHRGARAHCGVPRAPPNAISSGSARPRWQPEHNEGRALTGCVSRTRAPCWTNRRVPGCSWCAARRWR
jgi:hypothetical protein